MNKHNPIDQLSDEVAERRMKNALRYALNTPPKPHKEMVGKSGRKARPASKGRVHKAKSRA